MCTLKVLQVKWDRLAAALIRCQQQRFNNNRSFLCKLWRNGSQWAMKILNNTNNNSICLLWCVCSPVIVCMKRTFLRILLKGQGRRCKLIEVNVWYPIKYRPRIILLTEFANREKRTRVSGRNGRF